MRSEILADVAQHPALPASELPRLKADMVRNLTLAKSQPQSMASEQFARALYGEHPYGRLFPTEAMVSGYTHADVQAFHAANFGAVARAPVRRRPLRRRGRAQGGARQLRVLAEGHRGAPDAADAVVDACAARDRSAEGARSRRCTSGCR